MNCSESAKKQTRCKFVRRRVLIFVWIVAVIVIVCTIANIVKDDVNTDIYTENSLKTITVYVSEGDTLWSIAELYCPKYIDIRNYITDVEKYNTLNNKTIYPGQAIVVWTTEN